MNNKSTIFSTCVSVANTILHYMPIIRISLHRLMFVDTEGYKKVKGGFFLPNHYGGGKTAQIWSRKDSGSMILSDAVFWKPNSLLTLVLINGVANQSQVSELEETLQSANLPSGLLSDEIISFQYDKARSLNAFASTRVAQYYTCTSDDVKKEGNLVREGYHPEVFRNRFQGGTRYALIRPDLIIFSQASTLDQLLEQLKGAKDLLEASQ